MHLLPTEARFPHLLAGAQSWSDQHVLQLQGGLRIICPGASLVILRSPREAAGLNDLPKEHGPRVADVMTVHPAMPQNMQKQELRGTWSCSSGFFHSHVLALVRKSTIFSIRGHHPL